VAIPPQTIDQLLKTAESALQKKKVEQALIAYRKALILVPDSVEAQIGIAHAELMAGRESVSAQEYERVLLRDGRNETALHELAQIYSHQRQTWNRSEAKYKDYLNLKSGDVAARLELARIYVWERKSKEAVEILSSDAVRTLMTFEDQKAYAFALFRLGRDRDAEPILKKLTSSRPDDAEVREQLASIYASRKDWGSALPLYEQLLRNHADDSHLNLTYGVGLLAIGNYKASLVPLGNVLKQSPNNGEARLAYARAWKGAGNLKKATQEFGRAIPPYRQDPAVVREYADMLLEKRDYRGAENSYKDALALGLRDKRLVAGLAGALLGRGKNREALPYLREAYANEPTDRQALELARTLKKLGHNKEALEVLEKVEQSRQ
jgi:Flp pilus assembly protein TadD